MPHIHTEPGQHDMTISAWIIRTDHTEPLVLVHMHRKLGKLMQVGGHIELNETPWKALSHEITEESGYTLDELKVLQPTAELIPVDSAIVHPVPLLFNTHKVNDTHYHSDLVYGFVADQPPQALPADGESSDLRWLTLGELQTEAEQGNTLRDIPGIYSTVMASLERCLAVEATLFSLEEPAQTSL